MRRIAGQNVLAMLLGLSVMFVSTMVFAADTSTHYEGWIVKVDGANVTIHLSQNNHPNFVTHAVVNNLNGRTTAITVDGHPAQVGDLKAGMTCKAVFMPQRSSVPGYYVSIDAVRNTKGTLPTADPSKEPQGRPPIKH